MARTDTLGHYLTDVATAIKNKKGDQTPILASDFDTEITNLPSGGGGTVGNFAPKKIYFSGITDTEIDARGFKSTNLDNGSNGVYQNMFNSCANAVTIRLDSFNPEDMAQNITSYNLNGMFNSCSNLEDLVLSNSFQITRCISLYQTFAYCPKIKWASIKSIIENLDTKNVTTMEQTFRGCTTLPNLDLSGWDTGKVTTMTYLFQGCSSMTDLDLSNWDTRVVANMSYMFNYASSLESLDLSSFNFGSCTGFNDMFSYCTNLEQITFSSSATAPPSNTNLNLSYMFAYCDNLESVDLSFLSTHQITNFSAMFRGCSSLTSVDLSGMNSSYTSSINVGNMFRDCTSLQRLDMRNFNFAGHTYSSITSMFGSGASNYIPQNCLIIVADATQKAWFNNNTNASISRLTNVKTVAEVEGA